MSNDHRIERVSVISQAEDMASARAQQSTLSRLVRGPIARAWGRVMDRYVGVEDTIVIERLELRLTNWSDQLSEREIEQRLSRALEEQLQKHLTAPVPAKGRVVPVRTAVWQADRWADFLVTGRWYDASEQTSPQAFFTAAVGESAITLLPAWQSAYRRGGRQALARLYKQLPLDRLAIWLAGQWGESVPAAAFTLTYWQGKGRSLASATLLFQTWLQTVAVAIASDAERQQWSDRFWAFLLAQWPADQPLPKLNRLRGWPPAWRRVARNYGGIPPKDLAAADRMERNTDAIDPEPLTVESREGEAAANSFVNGAGIVLLHPYLATFFAKLELLDSTGKDFRDTTAREQALQICHWLVTGESQCAEQQTLLYQLLCAWPTGAVPTTDHAIPIEWLTAGEQLLQAVIRNWDKLGQSTPEALREGFLQRSGKLGRDGMGDHLRVEQRGVDVLLEFLPWGIGIVKLPWMKRLLRVEWT